MRRLLLVLLLVPACDDEPAEQADPLREWMECIDMCAAVGADSALECRACEGERARLVEHVNEHGLTDALFFCERWRSNFAELLTDESSSRTQIESMVRQRANCLRGF